MQILSLPVLQRQRYDKLRHVASPRIENATTLENAGGGVKLLPARSLTAHKPGWEPSAA
jgi:hypothetical protein